MHTNTVAQAGIASRTPSSAQRQALAEHTLVQFRRARDADPETCRVLVEDVVNAHLWLADAIARRYRNRGEDADDLRQIARSGLVEACTRFDPEHGAFVAFASATITGLVRRHFRDHAWSIRPPRPVQELSSEIWRRWPEVAQAVGGEPSERHLAEALETSVDEVRRARHAGQAYSCSSLDILPQEYGADRCGGEQSEARVLVESVWCELTTGEQQLLRMRFFEERSQNDIGAELGVSQMQISRELARLMTKLRGLIGALDEAAAHAA